MQRAIILSIIFLAATSTGWFTLWSPAQFSYGEPLAAREVVPLVVKDERAAILFTGDLMLARRVETMLDAYGSDFTYRRMPSRASSTDWVVTNFEAASPKQHVHTPDLTFRFSVATEHLPALRSFGVTHASLANNHSYDAGTVGYRETNDALRTAGITPFGDQHVGSSTVSVLNTNGVTVAVFGLYAVDVTPDLGALEKLFKAYASTTYQIAYIHWGSEYAPVHITSTEALATKLVSVGFDAIIGHHPHVVQDIGLIDGVPVFYSLGNFIFDQYFSEAVQVGLLVRLLPYPDVLRFTLEPITSLDSRSQPRLMTELEKTNFLAKIAAKSDPLLRTGISAGQLDIAR